MPAELFSVEQVERARRYHRPLYVALLLDVTLGLAVLSAAAFTGAGDRLYDVVDSLPWWGRALAFPALVRGVSSLVRLPLAFWRGYVRERRWGFSTQTARGWIFDRVKSLGVGVVLTCAALLGLVGLARAFPSGWPAVAAPAAAAGLRAPLHAPDRARADRRRTRLGPRHRTLMRAHAADPYRPTDVWSGRAGAPAGAKPSGF